MRPTGASQPAADARKARRASGNGADGGSVILWRLPISRLRNRPIPTKKPRNQSLTIRNVPQFCDGKPTRGWQDCACSVMDETVALQKKCDEWNCCVTIASCGFNRAATLTLRRTVAE